MNTWSIITFLSAAIPAVGAGPRFPSAASSKSPDGKWELMCRSPVNGQMDAGHVLLLTKAGRRSCELRRFERHCDALWSPDSSHIAVTDWWASDRADVFLYDVATPGLGRSVASLVPRTAIPKKEFMGHCYFEASKWLDSHRVQIKVSGHTDEAPVYNF